MRTSTKRFVVSAALALVPARAMAQAPPADLLSAAVRVAAAVRDSGERWGAAIWPGYRPDTIPLLYVMPGRGTALLNWRGALPDGFAALPAHPGAGWRAEADRGAASTSVTMDGRTAAQMVVRRDAYGAMLGLTLHEAFHAWYVAQRREGRRFGTGENAFHVGSYPVFSAENEAGMALEGRLLAAALAERSAAAARTLLRQYVAVRERRARSLTAALQEFEEMAELNEGLAAYAQTRGELWGGLTAAQTEFIPLLDDLTGAPDRSIRLRYYATGAALALLLDRLAGSDWKTRVVAENLTVLEMAAQASGHHADEVALQRAAERRVDLAALRLLTQQRIASLQQQRRQRVDSLFAVEGILVELDGAALPNRFIGHCGFDPMNTLQVGDGTILHTRWLAVCGSGNRWRGEFNTPVHQNADFSILRARLGAEGEVRLTVAGQPVAWSSLTRLSGATAVQIESPGLTLRLARADLERDGRTLRIRLPAP